MRHMVDRLKKKSERPGDCSLLREEEAGPIVGVLNACAVWGPEFGELFEGKYPKRFI